MELGGRGVVVSLVYVSVLRGICATVLMTFLPVYAVSVGLELPDIANIIAIASAIGVTSTPLFGFIADAIGRKFCLLVSSILLSLANIVAFSVNGYLGILLAYILFNLAINSWTPARAASIASSVGEESMGTSFALLSLSFQLSRMITPFVSGLLIMLYGYPIVFTFASAIAVLAAVITLVLVPETTNNINRVFNLREFYRTLIPSKHEFWFLVFLSIDRAGWRLWIPILNSYMKAVLGFTEDIIGFVNTFRGISSVIGVLPLGKLVDKHGWFPAIVLSEVLAIVAVILIPMTSNAIIMALSMFFIGLSIASWVPSYNVAISTIAFNKSELARTYARANFYRSLTAIPSPWIGGILYSIATTLPFIVSTILFTANTVILILGRTLNRIK